MRITAYAVSMLLAATFFSAQQAGHDGKKHGAEERDAFATVDASERRSHSGRCWTGPVIHSEPRW